LFWLSRLSSFNIVFYFCSYHFLVSFGGRITKYPYPLKTKSQKSFSKTSENWKAGAIEQLENAFFQRSKVTFSLQH